MLSMTTTASMAYTSSEISTVSDEQLLKEIVDKDTDVVYSGDKTGGTKNKTQKCGRVTAYMNNNVCHHKRQLLFSYSKY